MAPLRVGVIFEETQLSDLIGIDLIGNCGKPLISCMTEFGYPDLVSKAYDIEFLYISSSLDAAITTPGVRVLPTHTYDNAPRNLDIILVGGPHPKHRPAASLKFFREAVKESKVILSVCTGSMWLAASGILDGKKATTNRFFIPAAKKLYPEVEWLDQRWVVDESTSAAGEGGGRGGAHLWIAGAADCGKSVSS